MVWYILKAKPSRNETIEGDDAQRIWKKVSFLYIDAFLLLYCEDNVVYALLQYSSYIDYDV